MTRLHVRYDGAHFPEDLVFQETGDRSNFQGRYILRHAWTGNETCSEADAYRRELSTRREKEAQTLASPDRLGHQRDPAQTGPGAARRRRRPRLVAASLAVRSVR